MVDQMVKRITAPMSAITAMKAIPVPAAARGLYYKPSECLRGKKITVIYMAERGDSDNKPHA